jgi:NitT/TauT family transport system substrate-binding protein
MKNKNVWVAVGVVIIAVAGFLVFQNQKKSEESTPKKLDDVTIGYSALRISLPILVAQDKGYFAEQGLNVKLERFDTAQPLMQSLIAGSIQIGGYTALPITYTAMLRGKTDLYFVTSMLEDQNHRISSLIIPKDSPSTFNYSDLKGKKIGILPTVAYKVWLEELLKNKGVDLKSVEITQLDPAMQANALQSGQVNALFTNDPVATTVIQKGVGKLLSNEVEIPKIFGEPFIFGSLNIRKDFADANPIIAKKVIVALDKAVEYINSNPAEANQVLKNYLSEAQKPFVDFYPNALYQKSTEADPKIFQQIADKSTQLGIIDGALNVENLVISSESLSK